MRSKISEDGRSTEFKPRDLMAGENPWNGIREVGESGNNPRVPNTKHTTLEKPPIQPPAWSTGRLPCD